MVQLKDKRLFSWKSPVRRTSKVLPAHPAGSASGHPWREAVAVPRALRAVLLVADANAKEPEAEAAFWALDGRAGARQ